jgi:predicted transcriptional regulator
MQTLKQEAIEAISRLPETASVDEMMYELYVIDKISKGREAARQGETISTEELKKEIRSW